MSILENLKKLESEKGLGGSDYFKVKSGNNVIRVLTEGVYHESEFKAPNGRVSITQRFVMLIVDRTDGRVKPYFAPYTVYKQIAQLETDPFYAFQGMPMPYDVNIKVENAGTINAEYSVQASPNKTELTPDEVQQAASFGSIADYLKKLNEAKQPSTEEDVPFPTEAPPVKSPAELAAEGFARSTGKEAPDFLR